MAAVLVVHALDPGARTFALLCAGCGGASAVAEPKPPVAVTEVSVEADGVAASEASAESDPSADQRDLISQARAAAALGASSDDPPLEAGLEGLGGATASQPAGSFGWGVRGPGTVGGGTGQGTIGLGSIGTSGAANTGSGFGSGPSRSTLQVKLGEPTVQGALDPQVVRRVLRRHVSQLRYCYAAEQAKAPQLAGALGVTLTIGPRGDVAAAHIASTTLKNAAVESCVLARLQTMTFPVPERGVVQVVVSVDFQTPPPPPPPTAPAASTAPSGVAP